MNSLMTSFIRYYKVLMASNKRCAGNVTFNLETRILKLVCCSHRFNENGGDEAGTAITPALIVPNHARRSAVDVFLGMDGSTI